MTLEWVMIFFGMTPKAQTKQKQTNVIISNFKTSAQQKKQES